MEIDKEKIIEIRENTQNTLLQAEQERIQKRMENGLDQLARGNHLILLNDEFAKQLPHLLTGKRYNSRDNVITPLLAQLGEIVCHEESRLRQRALTTFSLLSVAALDHKDHEVIEKLLNTLVPWLRVEEEFIAGFEVMCDQIQRMCHALLERGQWQAAAPMVTTLHQIQSGALKKQKLIRSGVAKTQDRLAEKQILEKLIVSYLRDNTAGSGGAAGDLLKSLGKGSVIFLINKLMHSLVKDERILLLELLPETGNVAIPVLKECLQKKPPWYVIRNIILILSKINDPSLLSLVMPYLQHSDVRVQQQVIQCIDSIGGTEKNEMLLQALSLVSDDLKIPLVMQLSQESDQQVREAFTVLLRKKMKDRGAVTEELLSKLCVALRLSSSLEATDIVQQLYNHRLRTHGEEDAVVISAQETLRHLEPQRRHRSKHVPESQESVTFAADPQESYSAKTLLLALEEELRELIESEQFEEAGDVIYQKIITAAGEKDFLTAETLRDKLLAVNPMALDDVIRAGEIIEQEKSSAITSHHLNLWSELYDAMGTEEFNALYHAMREEIFEENEVIVKAGEVDPSLFFLNSGMLHVTCKSGRNEVFLKKLQPTDIIGMDQFFASSVWTVSVSAHSTSKLHVLAKEELLRLEKEFPGLEKKLRDFGKKFDIVPELIRMSGEDRREHPRYVLSRAINNMLLDPYGNRGKRSFMGEMVDLSTGGLCFAIHLSSRESARLLLGRRIISEVQLGSGEIIHCKGVIVGVKYKENMEQDFTVHVKFHTLMDQETIKRITHIPAQ